MKQRRRCCWRGFEAGSAEHEHLVRRLDQYAAHLVRGDVHLHHSANPLVKPSATIGGATTTQQMVPLPRQASCAAGCPPDQTPDAT